MPVWHASVSIVGRADVRGWSADDDGSMRHEARKLLRGVGLGEDIWDLGVYAVHLRRRVHPSELDWQATDVRK